MPLPVETDLLLRIQALGACVMALRDRIATLEKWAATPAPTAKPSAEVFFYGEKVGRVIADRWRPY